MSGALSTPSRPSRVGSPTVSPRLEAIDGYCAYAGELPAAEQDFAYRSAMAEDLRSVTQLMQRSIRLLGPESLPDLLNYMTRLARLIAVIADRLEEGPLRTAPRGRSPYRGARLRSLLGLDIHLSEAVGVLMERSASWGMAKVSPDEWIARFASLEAQAGEILAIFQRRERCLSL